MSPSLIEFLIRWRAELQQNNKPDQVIYIPHDAWYEFCLTLEMVLAPNLGQMVLDETIVQRKEQTKLVGFIFRRAPLHAPMPHPLLRPGWDGRFT